ncbi:MAG: putative bifunctional diguanylate cyclase/phosphodiesterase [Microcystaceae cyanobacterium]
MSVSLQSVEQDSLTQLGDLIVTHHYWLLEQIAHQFSQTNHPSQEILPPQFISIFSEQLSQCLVNLLQSHPTSLKNLQEIDVFLDPLTVTLKQQYRIPQSTPLRFSLILRIIQLARRNYLELLTFIRLSEVQLHQLQYLLNTICDRIEVILAYQWETLQQNTHFTQLNQQVAQSHQQILELKASEKQLQNLINTDSNGLLVVDTQGMVLFANAAAQQLFGYSQDQLLGETLGLPILEGKFTEIEIFKPDQTLVIAHLQSVSLQWRGKPAHLVSLTDITESKQLDNKMRVIWRAIEKSPVNIVITDVAGNIEYVNSKFEQLTGYSRKEAIGQNPRLLKSGVLPDETYEHLWKTVLSGEDWHGELCNKKKNGELFWEMASIFPITNYQGTITHFVGIKENITERKQQEERLAYQANYDALTQLPNRFLVFDRLQQAIEQANRLNTQIAVMFLDLDHFKDINDTLGHDIGDQLLVQTAQRLSACVRKSDTIARLGGDEFLVILSNLDSYKQAEIVGNKILKTLAAPFHLGKEELFVSTSIGITLYPDDGSKTDILLRNADTAMYSAKRDGRNGFKFFTASMNDKAQKRQKIAKNLRYSLQKNEVYPVYQPLIDLSTQRIVGAEALMRWKNEKLGTIYPDQFIPIAEETGIIVELGAWMLHQACRMASQWRNYYPQFSMAVNLSPRQFRERYLLDTVNSAIEKYQLPSHCLELELTEQILLEDTPTANQLISQLHQMKIRLSLDDFGTGYSSLSYLKKFPFSVLKIDKSFIADISHDLDAVSLVQTIITMAHSLNLKVIAEGIETKQQAEFLKEAGCDYGQGYYFSQPILAEEFTQLLS